MTGNNKSLKLFALALIAGSIGAMMVLQSPIVLPAGGQPITHDTEHAQQASPSGDVTTTVGDELPGLPMPGWMSHREITGKLYEWPLLYFKYWSMQRLSPIPTVTFLLFFGILGWSVFPGTLNQAAINCRQQFWKTFFRGLVASAVALLSIRFLFDSAIGAPLAYVLLGLLELALMLGLTTTSRLMGGALLNPFPRITKALSGGNKLSQELLEICIGCLLLSAIILLPSLGPLPRVGPRFALLLALLGVGGISRTQSK